jgi:hypothetical protein
MQAPRSRRRVALWALALALLAGCAGIAKRTLDERFGPADPKRFDQPVAVEGLSFRAGVQPVLERRCAVCHGCYDAPCQLKLGSWEGLVRGASQAPVYDAERLRAATPSRLFVDAQLPSEWRTRDFFPVLNERGERGTREGSVLYRSLALKRENPLPADALLPKSLDVSLDATRQCPRIEEFDGFARSHPQAGMPYGLPGLDEREWQALVGWIDRGAPYEGPRPPSAVAQREIQAWERFLNGDSPKERLTARYLYEHWFLGHLYFEGDSEARAYRIVRSRTPPGRPIELIATRRPYDDPGVARAWYRIEPEREALLVKTHMPYVLSAARMARLRASFLAPEVQVKSLPAYGDALGSNPFTTFRDLPLKARYRFLLDDAQYFVMNFIKGPVCRGQLALSVIEDQFWVFFVDPDEGAGTAAAELLAREAGNLQLPNEEGSNSGVLLPWLEFAKREDRFLAAKSETLARVLDARRPPDLSLIWNGDGRNPNAALTVFRHLDSASVVRGLVGDEPKTAWVIGYPLLERIYYLLVAGYDVYGNVGHQLNSRLYMDFLRMEGEFNFLVLLPEASRVPLRDHWYRNTSDSVKQQVYGLQRLDRESGIAYRTSDPKRELFGLLRQRMAPVLERRYELDVFDAPLRRDLQALARLKGASLGWLPEAVFVQIDDAPRPPQYISLLRNTGHANVSHLFLENKQLLPAEDTLTVAAGLVGAYPNALYRVKRDELPALASAIATLGSEADYRRLADRFAVRRTHPGFWAASDTLHDARRWMDSDGGLFDYNRLENR